MKRKVIVHCDGCWETWEAYGEQVVGRLCSWAQPEVEVRVRLATQEEAEAYCSAISEGIVK